MRVFTLVKGFDIVRKGGGSKLSPTAVIKCIHYGKVTLNTRDLEDRVSRDEDGAVTSRRKRELINIR